MVSISEYRIITSMKVIGAITGDIIGSIYEFDNHRSKDFTLFGDGVEFTDDSVMTIATMQALINGGTHDDFVAAYKHFGKKYPSSYGSRFSHWLVADNPQPYDSWGNGSAMRVSPVAWYYDNLNDVERLAKVSAEVTHNHPEGIKGAQSIAAAIFLARTGKSKQDIKEYIEKKYEYFLDFKLDDIRETYQFDESSAGTVPPAIVAFLESTDFEDALRNAISIGGDSDTLAAITGSVAEAFYGVPNEVQAKTLQYLSDELQAIVGNFNKATAPLLTADVFRNLSTNNIEALRGLNARIQSHSGEWGVRHESKTTETGAKTFPWVEQDELIQKFVQFMYDKDLVVTFNWGEWQEGRDWYASKDEDKYEKLNVEKALKLLTAVIRNERFNDGALVRAFDDGTFPRIINKLITI